MGQGEKSVEEVQVMSYTQCHRSECSEWGHGTVVMLMSPLWDWESNERMDEHICSQPQSTGMND